MKAPEYSGAVTQNADNTINMADTIRKENEGKTPLVIQSLNIISVDRTPKDIRNWRDALRHAEAIQYPNRIRLYDLYKDVELDGHLSGIVNKRFETVLNKNLRFESKTDGGKVDAMDDLIDSTPFRNFITLILEQKLWGLSGAEFIPGKDFVFYPIPRKHIKPHLGIIAKEQTGDEGFDYTKAWNLMVWGTNDDLGLYLKCAPYAIWKKGGFSDWAQYVEIFGQPTRVAKYDTYDDKTRAELERTLRESGSSLAMMIPKQVDFEMMDGKTSNGTGELQERFKTACNQEMSIIILGNTETTSTSTSSGYAQAKEHGKQQLEITKSDLVFVTNALNDPKFLNILKSYGYPVDAGKFVFEKETDLEELEQRMAIDEKVASKVPVDDDHWYDTYGVSKPDNYEALKDKMEAERMMRMLPPAPPDNDGDDKKPAPEKKPEKPDKKPAKGNLSAWRNLRQSLADFFDPAP